MQSYRAMEFSVSVRISLLAVIAEVTYAVGRSKWRVLRAINPALPTLSLVVLDHLRNHMFHVNTDMPLGKLQSLSQVRQKGITASFRRRKLGMLYCELGGEKTDDLIRGRVMLVAEKIHKVEAFLLDARYLKSRSHGQRSEGFI